MQTIGKQRIAVLDAPSTVAATGVTVVDSLEFEKEG
jgi:hypothetical protein